MSLTTSSWFMKGILQMKHTDLPVDRMADARDESGKEHERFPVRSFFTGYPTHVAVRPRVALLKTQTDFQL